MLTRRVGHRGASRNARRPDSISNSTQPNAQMSVRLSTGLPARLLGAHVGRRPEDAALFGAVERARRPLGQVTFQPDGHRLGQAEVEHLSRARRRRGRPPRLPTLCSTMLAASDRDGRCLSRASASSASAIWRTIASASGDRQRPARQAIGEGRSLDQLERQRRHAIGFLQAVDGADVRMVERGEQSRLAREAGAALGVGREVRRKDFDRPRRARACCRARDNRPRPCRPRRAARRSRRGRVDGRSSGFCVAPTQSHCRHRRRSLEESRRIGLVAQQGLNFLAAAQRCPWHALSNNALRASGVQPGPVIQVRNPVSRWPRLHRPPSWTRA